MQFKIKEVTVETGKGGKYKVANVVYDFKGDTRTQKVVSFANPEVFKTVQELTPGTLVDVEVGKNEQGYIQWITVKKATDAPAPSLPAESPKSGKYVSTYETPEERALKQLYIIRQSSIANAITTLSVNIGKEKLDPDNVIDIAEKYVEFVYGVQNTISESAKTTLEEMDSDIPY